MNCDFHEVLRISLVAQQLLASKGGLEFHVVSKLLKFLTKNIITIHQPEETLGPLFNGN
jgi:hypothetical protein